MKSRKAHNSSKLGGLMFALFRHILLFFLLAIPMAVTAQPNPITHTAYDSDGDFFQTKGQVTVNVPYTILGQIAADFPRYRDWGMHEINKNKNGKKFSIIFRDVVYLPGGRGGHGIFRIFFDLDWPWPFGAKNKRLDFAILQAVPNGRGGIKRLVIDIEEKGTLLKTFELDLWAIGDETTSSVKFKSKVKFNGLVDTFFSLSRFRENIEYRIVKVIQNLQREAEQTSASNARTRGNDTPIAVPTSVPSTGNEVVGNTSAEQTELKASDPAPSHKEHDPKTSESVE